MCWTPRFVSNPQRIVCKSQTLPKYAESWLKLTLEKTGNKIRPKWWSQLFFLCWEPEDVGGPAIPEGSGWSGVWRNISSSVCFLEVIIGYTKFYPRVEKIMFLRKISIEPVYSNGWETMTFFLQSQTASISWPQTFSWNLQKPFVNSSMVRFYPCSLCILSCSESQIPHSIKPGNLGESLYDGPHLSTYVVPSESTQNFKIRTDFG